jgi:hypothetical protein
MIVAGKLRYVWPIIALMIAAATFWVLIVVWHSPHRNDLATFGAFAVALVLPAAGWITSAWRRRTAQGDEARTDQALDRFADVFAQVVNEQWTRAAGARRLLEPEPVAVRWNQPSMPLTGPASAAVGSHRFRPLPGLHATSLKRLQAGSTISELHAVYGGLGSGRLVIAGAPGSGKSGAAVRLVLAALKYREQAAEADRPRIPVPVIFTMHGWDPDKRRIQDWLVERFQRTYSQFVGRRGAMKAAGLLAADRIAVILDGLDELPEALRSVALRKLSEQATTFRVIVLTRSAEMATAAAEHLLEGAAAIELQEVDPATAASYLTRVQIHPPPAGWRQLIGTLRHHPASPISQALSSPLALTLVRDTYRTGDDVSELFDFCRAAGPGVSREDIEDHLLDRVLPAAYPADASSRYERQMAQNTLGLIAERMTTDGTRDLEWWQIPTWTPRAPHAIAIGLAVGTAGWLASEILHRDWFFRLTLVIGGLVIGAEFMYIRRGPRRIGRPRLRKVLNGPARWWVLFLSLYLGFLVGITFFIHGIAIGIATGLVLAVASYLFFGLWVALSQPAGDAASPLNPLAAWRADQTRALMYGLAAGLAAGLVSGVIYGTFVSSVSQTSPFLRYHSFGQDAWFGLRIALVVGLVVVIVLSVTWPVSLVFADLAVRRHTPISLMRFLEDAREREVMRTVGPVYQFRHGRLQDRLAEHVHAGSSDQSLEKVADADTNTDNRQRA